MFRLFALQISADISIFHQKEKHRGNKVCLVRAVSFFLFKHLIIIFSRPLTPRLVGAVGAVNREELILTSS